MSLKNSIEKLMNNEGLDFATCQTTLNELLTEEANPLQVAAFLVLLRKKGETPEELAGFASVLRQKMVPLVTPHKVLDIVGTGGDGTGTINISTGSAILAASCGVKIAKHGNRAVSSLTGSADVLTALNIEINLPPEKIAACIDEVGIGFCFSPHFHPAMQALRALRKQLNVPTTFNVLGPLLNPASPSHYLLGVYHEKLLPIMARALEHLKVERSMVVVGPGLDEISCLGTTALIEIHQGALAPSFLHPEQFGLTPCTLAELQGGDAQTNASIFIDIFSGANRTKTRAMAESMILNAAVALVLYGKYHSINDAVLHARQNLQDGSAFSLLNRWIEFSHD